MKVCVLLTSVIRWNIFVGQSGDSKCGMFVFVTHRVSFISYTSPRMVSTRVSAAFQ